jgi:hypothetical protein
MKAMVLSQYGDVNSSPLTMQDLKADRINGTAVLVMRPIM